MIGTLIVVGWVVALAVIWIHGIWKQDIVDWWAAWRHHRTEVREKRRRRAARAASRR